MGTVESKPLSRDIALFDRLVPDEGIVAFSEKDVYAVDLTVEPASKAIWYESRHFSLFFANRGHLVRKDNGQHSNAFLLSHARNPTPKVLFKQALKGCNSFRFTKDGFKGVTDATEEYYSHVGVVPMQASAAAHFDVLVSRFAHQDRQPGAYTSEYLSTCFVFVVAELCGTKMVLAAYPARRKVTTVRIVRLSP
jgi:hypothetical protein